MIPGVLLFDLPTIREPVPVFAIAIVIFLIAPLVLERVQLPGIIGVLLAGILVGPHVLDILPRGRTIRLLGMIGLLYLLFISGLEIDLNEFFDDPKQVAVFGVLTFSLPLVLGVAGGMAVLDLTLLAAILFAAMFSSHTILSYPVLQQLDILKNKAVTTTVSVALLTDTTALLILAVVENVAGHGGGADLLFWVRFLALLAAFFVGIWVVVPRIGRWFFRNVDEESYFEYLFTLAVVFVTASLAILAGADPIVGAFLAGITMNRLVPSTSTLMNRIEFVGNAIFIPFFFLSVGMLVKPRIFLQRLEPWIIAGTMIGIMVVTKFVAAVLTGRIYDYERYEWLTMFSISTGQGPAAIAIALIGARSGLFSQTLVNAVVLLIVVSALISPFLSKRFGRQIVESEEKSEYEPSDAPERIMVPLTEHTENRDLLLDFSMLIRGSNSDESIYTVTVVRNEDQLSVIDTLDTDSLAVRYGPGSSAQQADDGDRVEEGRVDADDRAEADRGDDGDRADEVDDANQDAKTRTDSEVAKAEETLEAAEEYGAGAEIPVDTQTRVDDDVVHGITQAMRDNRITTAVVGWNSRHQFGHRLFGTTIDQLLDRTDELVFVAALDQQLNVTERIVVVLPGRIAAHPGFYHAIHATKDVTKQLGVPAEFLVVGGETDQYERLVDSVEPDVPFEVDGVSGWQQLRADGDRFEAGSLVIALSPRKGSRGWESGLETLQRDLASMDVENLAVAYLSEESEWDSNRRFLRI